MVRIFMGFKKNLRSPGALQKCSIISSSTLHSWRKGSTKKIWKGSQGRKRQDLNPDQEPLACLLGRCSIASKAIFFSEKDLKVIIFLRTGGIFVSRAAAGVEVKKNCTNTSRRCVSQAGGESQAMKYDGIPP